jgi:multiple sugar transport system ATP-binding protein
MNFLQGELREEGGQLVFRERDGGSVALPLGVRPGARSHVGKAVTLGIRPEHCDVVPPGQPAPPAAFQAVADIVEPLGAETFVYLNTGAHTVISRSLAPMDQREAGQRLRLRLDGEKALLFDPETTERIP